MNYFLCKGQLFNMVSNADRVYQHPLSQIDDFRFDDRVVQVFPDMINRSVPGYALLIDMIGGIAKNHVSSTGVCYDLGCSLGAVSFSLRRSIPFATARIIGIDNSAAMIRRAHLILERMDGQVPVEFIERDIVNTEFEPCELVVLNFTLQFIARELRIDLLSRIQQALKPGGILVLAEKITFIDKQINQQLTEFHHEFKRNQGYSDLEIVQKRTALENVLLPDTATTHLTRLQQAGFTQACQWFQCFNFAAFMAVKAP